MPRPLALLRQMTQPAWWRSRYGSLPPNNHPFDLLRGGAALLRKRWSLRRAMSAAGLVPERRNADFMVDVFRSLGLPYAAANSGTTVLPLHESIINYGGNTAPEFLTCLHEEAAVAIASGYGLATGKPMLVLLHGTIGVLHAAAAIAEAKAMRAPVLLLAGNGARFFDIHNARDLARDVRADLKWDDEPGSINEFAPSAVRAYKIATASPCGPVLLVVDQLLQEMPFTRHHLEIPAVVPTVAPRANQEGIREAAARLLRSSRPLIVAHRAPHRRDAMRHLTELAETIQVPCQSLAGPAIPHRHPLAGGGGKGYHPDLVLSIDADGALPAEWQDVEQIAMSASPAFSALVLRGDAEATLPVLIEECRRLITADLRQNLIRRGEEIADRHREERQQWQHAAGPGADEGPIPTARAIAELWPLIRDEDWSLASCGGCPWPGRLWDFDEPHRYIGSGGPGTALGAALACRAPGHIAIQLQTDVALARSPGALWTAAHHRIPLLTLVLRTATSDSHGIRLAEFGQSLGVASEGPLTKPGELAAAYRRGLERVKRGEPALIEVVVDGSDA